MSNYANNTPCELTLTSKATPLSTENGWWINAPFCLLLASLPANTQCWIFAHLTPNSYVQFILKFIYNLGCFLLERLAILSWIQPIFLTSDYFFKFIVRAWFIWFVLGPVKLNWGASCYRFFVQNMYLTCKINEKSIVTFWLDWSLWQRITSMYFFVDKVDLRWVNWNQVKGLVLNQ